MLLDGTALRYYAPRDVQAKTLLSTEFRLAPAHVSAAAAERARSKLYADLGLAYRPVDKRAPAQPNRESIVQAWPVATVTLSRTAVSLALTGDGR